MSAWHSSKESIYGYYICQHKTKGCVHHRMHRIERVHEAVSQSLRALLLDEQALAVTAPPAPILDLRPDIERLQLQLTRAKDAYLAGAFDVLEYKQTRAALEAKVGSLETQAASVGARPVDLNAARRRLTRAVTLERLHEVMRAANAHVTLH